MTATAQALQKCLCEVELRSQTPHGATRSLIQQHQAMLAVNTQPKLAWCHFPHGVKMQSSTRADSWWWKHLNWSQRAKEQFLEGTVDWSPHATLLVSIFPASRLEPNDNPSHQHPPWWNRSHHVVQLGQVCLPWLLPVVLRWFPLQQPPRGFECVEQISLTIPAAQVPRICWLQTPHHHSLERRNSLPDPARVQRGKPHLHLGFELSKLSLFYLWSLAACIGVSKDWLKTPKNIWTPLSFDIAPWYSMIIYDHVVQNPNFCLLGSLLLSTIHPGVVPEIFAHFPRPPAMRWNSSVECEGLTHPPRRRHRRLRH